ncbi:MAG: DUF1571 domain-containing protein [Sedimentisphaerales bacterium]|nr:DUF1571 domain-containing protein [Sedimentisphaerales bacterium]
MRSVLTWIKSAWLARILIGALVGIFVYQGISGSSSQDNTAASRLVKAALAQEQTGQEEYTDRLISLAKTDHIALLEWACENYIGQVQDYSLTLIKQERINDSLKPAETVSVVFRERPFSVLMKWQENAGMADKVLYAEGSNDNKMLVHPTGLLGWIKSVKKDPRSKEVKQSSRRTPDQFGFYRSMQSLLEIYRLARERGDLRIGYVGKTQVDDRTCIAMERLLPDQKDYPYARLVMEFDAEFLLPTAVTCYDWQGRLLSRYEYRDIRFNIGLTPEMFTAKANGM